MDFGHPFEPETILDLKFGFYDQNYIVIDPLHDIKNKFQHLQPPSPHFGRHLELEGLDGKLSLTTSKLFFYASNRRD